MAKVQEQYFIEKAIQSGFKAAQALFLSEYLSSRRDEQALACVRLHNTFTCQIPIGACHCVGVDDELLSQYPNDGELRA
jgi:hypothetical protein